MDTWLKIYMFPNTSLPFHLCPETGKKETIRIQNNRSEIICRVDGHEISAGIDMFMLKTQAIYNFVA